MISLHVLCQIISYNATLFSDCFRVNRIHL